MNVSLTPQLESWVKQKVESGRYHSASEVIREGLRLLDDKEQAQQAKLDALRQDIRDGLDSGEPSPLDMDDVIRRGQERQAKKAELA